MTAQQKARARNWNKYRITGGNILTGIDSRFLSESERSLIREVDRIWRTIKDNWDANTEIVLGHPLPPYICSMCHKRGNNQYLINDINYCFKHGTERYRELQEAADRRLHQLDTGSSEW